MALWCTEVKVKVINCAHFIEDVAKCSGNYFERTTTRIHDSPIVTELCRKPESIDPTL